MRCAIAPNAPLTAVCNDCGHVVREHWTEFCLACIELKLIEATNRTDRLALAVQVLTERLDAGRIENLERRLDEFIQSWPRRKVTSDGSAES
jgi:hypothetical protein